MSRRGAGPAEKAGFVEPVSPFSEEPDLSGGRSHDCLSLLINYIRRAVDAALAAIALAFIITCVYAFKADGAVRLGVYDPFLSFKDSHQISIEHLFISWNSFREDEFRSQAQYAAARKRQLLISIEPWTRALDGKDGSETLFSEILSGGFDAEVESICTEIGKIDGQVLVRWAHEMDDNSGRYPWANQPADLYVAGYHYFVESCRRFAPQTRYVWSPKGLETLSSYFPGDAYVDYVGIPLFCLQSWDVESLGRSQDFTARLGYLYRRVTNYGKPIIAVEIGVAGDAAYRKAWVSSMKKWGVIFPRLEALVYFNAQDSVRWPGQHGFPDWRISPSDFAAEPAGIP
jgi:beta-mannanase